MLTSGIAEAQVRRGRVHAIRWQLFCDKPVMHEMTQRLDNWLPKTGVPPQGDSTEQLPWDSYKGHVKTTAGSMCTYQPLNRNIWPGASQQIHFSESLTANRDSGSHTGVQKYTEHVSAAQHFKGGAESALVIFKHAICVIHSKYLNHPVYETSFYKGRNGGQSKPAVTVLFPLPFLSQLFPKLMVIHNSVGIKIA